LAKKKGHMTGDELPLDQVIHGDCIEVLKRLPEQSVDLIFADPPYNLQLSQELWRPNMTRVDAVDEAWDKFESFSDYDAFSRAWMQGCRRILKDSGTLWVIGTYHNIYRLGAILQDLGYWILNDVVWVKTNPMPNFRGVRFTNAHETLLWACKFKGAKYTFNYHAMKSLHGDKQMRSDWHLPLCTGRERIQAEGQRAHPTQKPEALLYRVILAASNPGDVVLDPFFGTGTTGIVAKMLHRRWVGIEKEARYVELARQRIAARKPEPFDAGAFEVRDRRRMAPRVPFARLLELGLLLPGQRLYFRRDRKQAARIKPDGKLAAGDFTGSIHQAGKHLMGGSPCNGWEHWYYKEQDGSLQPIDRLRQEARRQLGLTGGEET
jgi:modification methylase